MEYYYNEEGISDIYIEIIGMRRINLGGVIMNIRKVIVLTLLICVVLLILSGCGEKLPDGIENKTFFKDLSKAYGLIVRSMSDQTYYEDEINDIFSKMNKESYKIKLNDYELLILETLSNSLPDVKKDLTTGDRIIQSATTNEFKWILDMMSNHFKEKYNK